MKKIKANYVGKSRVELLKALELLNAQQLKSKMTVRDDVKAYGALRKMRYEIAVVKSLLTLEANKQ